MVKPALLYLDILALARQRINRPLAAYSVSGESTMIQCAAAQGSSTTKDRSSELNTGIKRAGADIIITYFAKGLARWMKEAPL